MPFLNKHIQTLLLCVLLIAIKNISLKSFKLEYIPFIFSPLISIKKYYNTLTYKNYSVIISIMDEFEYIEKSKNEIITIDSLNKKMIVLSVIFSLMLETKILF